MQLETDSNRTTIPTEIQWSTYANYYDAMCENNPSYDEMLVLVVEKALECCSASHAQVLDIGAGTGNLILRLAKLRPNWNFVHLDYDVGMNEKAAAKYAAHNLSNVQIIQESAEDAEFTNNSFDVVLSTNAIYAIPEYQEVLRNAHNWLSSTGTFVAVDFGRPQNTNDWLIYIARSMVSKVGILRTFRTIRENWEAARQNRRTTEAQNEGNYWLHDNAGFVSELESAGFVVSYNAECYRGYSDIAVCRKSPVGTLQDLETGPTKVSA